MKTSLYSYKDFMERADDFKSNYVEENKLGYSISLK